MAKKRAAAKKKVTKKKTTKRSPQKKKKETKATKKEVTKRATRKKRADSKKDPAPLVLRGKLFLEYRAAMAELFQHQSEYKLAQFKHETELLKPEYRPLLMSQQKLEEVALELGKVQGSFKAVQKRVAEKLGVSQDDLVKYTINEATGRIVFTPPKEEG